MGGDCLNVGCVPSKALLRSARAAAEVRRAGEYGVRTGVCETDFDAVMERMRGLRADLSPNDSVRRFSGLGVDVFLGDAVFVSKDTVDVNGARLRFARACIATGARASVPPIEGLAGAGYLTNETVFSLRSLPRRFGVLGGGPIGCELAQAFARFGASVALFEAADRLLGNDEIEASHVVERALRDDGVDVRTGAQVVRVEARDGAKRLHVRGADGRTEEVVVDELLVAVGRAPNVEGLGLEAAGVAYDLRSGVRVDAQLRTSNPHVFAAGDVCSAFKFTHAADAAARIVIRNALFFGRARYDKLAIPWCTHTDPQVAHVGATSAELQRRGIAADTIVVPMAEVDRARLDGEERGFLKVHLAPRGDTILGATLVGAHAGESISELTAAMAMKTGLGRLADVIHCYPTQAEAIKKAADAYNRTRLTPRVRRLFESMLALRRSLV
jgi:pyruvate/2-oxoglutarate dehydrogenase complex dihydrolipoamide dehydrogenase (E3) component